MKLETNELIHYTLYFGRVVLSFHAVGGAKNLSMSKNHHNKAKDWEVLILKTQRVRSAVLFHFAARFLNVRRIVFGQKVERPPLTSEEEKISLFFTKQRNFIITC